MSAARVSANCGTPVPKAASRRGEPIRQSAVPSAVCASAVRQPAFHYAAGGQFCDLEGDRSRPMHSGELWWNLIGAITKLQILGEYNRLEECAPLMKNAGVSCSAGRNG